MVKNPSKIRNKMKRAEIYAKFKQQKKKLKKEMRETKGKEAEALGEAVITKNVLFFAIMI